MASSAPVDRRPLLPGTQAHRAPKRGRTISEAIAPPLLPVLAQPADEPSSSGESSGIQCPITSYWLNNALKCQCTLILNI